MAITISGTNGIVGAGFTVDNSGVSVTAGVGTFGTLAAPAAGLTGALPALSAASLTSIPAANIVGVCTSGLTKTGGFGIANLDQWYVTANFTGSVDPIENNLARFTLGGSYLGSGMSVASGIWTFPTTGFWQVHFQARCSRVEAGRQSRYQQMYIKSSTDNFSSSEILAFAECGYYDNYDATYRYNGGYCSGIFDCTNTSTHKVRFATTVEDNDSNGVRWGQPYMKMAFVKLADT